MSLRRGAEWSGCATLGLDVFEDTDHDEGIEGHTRQGGPIGVGQALVAQDPVHAFLDEALLPALDGGLALAGLAHDCIRAEPVSRGEHDRCAPNVFLRAVAVRHDDFEPGAVHRGYVDDDPRAHAPNSHTITATEIL